MRHGKKVNHLSRKTQHRKAMLSNMATSLILHKRINTTVAKAKALRIYVEPLITRSKNDTTHSRREVFKLLQHKEATQELFREVSQKVADRPGGYTRIIKTGFREGDSAEMCLMELVDYNENLLAVKKEEKTATKRTRRRTRRAGSGTQKADTEQTKESAPKAEKQPKEEKQEKQEQPKSEQKADEKKEEPEAPADEDKTAEK